MDVKFTEEWWKRLTSDEDRLVAWLEALAICILLLVATFAVIFWALLSASKLVVGLVTLGVILYWIVYSVVKDFRKWD